MYTKEVRDRIIINLRPWIKGFITKEYGYLNRYDQEDLAQDGCTALVWIVDRLHQTKRKFPSKDEYFYYVKQVVRNAVRDVALKSHSRFDISLFKLRRALKEHGLPEYERYKEEMLRIGVTPKPVEKFLRENKQALGDFVTEIGNSYTYVTEDKSMDAIGTYEHLNRERLLSLLSQARKGGRELSLDECKKLLKETIKEYKDSLKNC